VSVHIIMATLHLIAEILLILNITDLLEDLINCWETVHNTNSILCTWCLSFI